MRRIHFREGKTLIFLSVVLVVLILCPTSDYPIERGNRGDAGQGFPAQANPMGKTYEFRLPVSLPESQVSDELVLTQAKDRSLLSGNRLTDVMLGQCMIWFGSMVLWQHSLRKLMQKANGHAPVISLRIGGHAPPAAVSF